MTEQPTLATDPIAALRQAETYLTVTHQHAARHDVLGDGYSCCGCALLTRITAALAATAPAETDEEGTS